MVEYRWPSPGYAPTMDLPRSTLNAPDATDTLDAIKPRRRPRWLPTLLVVFGAVALLAVVDLVARGGGTAGAVTWVDDWPSAKAEAAQRGKPILVYFSADWCPGCRLFSNTVLSEDRVAAALSERVVAYRAPLDTPDSSGQTLARRWGIEAIPAMVITDASGDPLSGYAGGLNEDEFLAWVDRHVDARRDSPANADADAEAVGVAGERRLP